MISRCLVCRQKRLLFVFFLIFFFIITASGQVIDPDKMISQYTHTIFNSDDGIREVLDIIQDNEGYLWLATYNGLIRYEGSSFKIYNESVRNDFPVSAVRALAIDNRNRLIIGSNSNGIAIYENNTFTQVNTDDGLTNNSVRKLFVDSKDNLWIGTAAGLNLYKDGKVASFSEFSDLNTSQVLFISEDSDGVVWIGLNKENGIYNYINGEMVHYQGISEFSGIKIEDLVCDTVSYDIWAISLSGLYQIRNNRIISEYEVNNFHYTDSSLFLQQLYFDHNNCLWIVADGGLIRFNQEEFSFYFPSDGLSNDLVNSVFQDREGTLWVGTGCGLDKFVEPKFTVFSQNEGLSNNGVNSILEVEPGLIWIATNQGISIFNKNENQFIETDALEEVNTRIRHLYKDSKGTVWISTYGDGLAGFYNGEINKWFNTDNGLAGNKVRTVMEDSQGNLWVGTTTGVSVISSGEIATYSLNTGMSFEYVMCFYEEDDGTVWIGTDGGGILFFKDGRFSGSLREEDGLAGDVIFRIFKDSMNVLWITTGNGISRIEDDLITNFNAGDGLLVNAVFQVIEDSNRLLWMTTTEGLFNIPANDFKTFSPDHNERLISTVYNDLNGLNGGITPTSWSIFDSDGDLWIPTYSGAAVFDPCNIPTNTVPPSVVIDNEMRIDNQICLLYDNMIINADTQRLSFSFSALSFQIPEKVTFQYKLVGFENTWSPLTPHREVNYTNLSPGEYSLHVRAQNNDGVFSEESAVFHFKKAPHFYETLWFLIFMVVAGFSVLFLIAVLIHRKRVNNLRIQLAQQQKELSLERKAKEKEALIMKSFSRFVPHEFLKLLNRDSIINVELGDQIQKEMTILVSDIRNFTALSETLSPEENFNFLNSYLAKMVPVVREKGGIIDKYIGDGIMALFPEKNEDAVDSAVKMIRSIDVFNSQRKKSGQKPVSIGISVHYGSVMLGTIGEPNRMDASVISDSVNLAFRLESLTKRYKCEIIISETVKDQLDSNKYSIRYLDKVVVKGKAHSIEIYELLIKGRNPVSDKKIKTIDLFNQGIEYYYSRNFRKAGQCFLSIYSQNKQDHPAKVFLKRCIDIEKNGLPDNWNGVVKLLKK